MFYIFIFVVDCLGKDLMNRCKVEEELVVIDLRDRVRMLKEEK